MELIKGSRGAFEVKLGDALLFSKNETGRFPEPGEVEAALGERIGSAV